MLCPLLNIKWKGEFTEWQKQSYINGFGECKKEKCAWWAESKRVYHTSAEYRSKTGCAIKLIAEK